MITENLSTLKIHKLTQEQYDRALEVGNIDPNALYLTPEKEPIFIQNDEPTDAEDGALWLDMDERSNEIYIQNDEPTDVMDGDLWVDLVNNGTVSGGGIGLPSGGTAGQVLTVGSDGKYIWADPTGGGNLTAAEEVLF